MTDLKKYLDQDIVVAFKKASGRIRRFYGRIQELPTNGHVILVNDKGTRAVRVDGIVSIAPCVVFQP